MVQVNEINKGIRCNNQNNQVITELQMKLNLKKIESQHSCNALKNS